MKLISLELKSYRSCLSSQISWDENLSALVGMNGVGKSNILQGILLIRKALLLDQFSHFRIERHKAKANNSSEFMVGLLHMNKKIWLRGTIEYDTDEHNVDEPRSCKLEWNFSEIMDVKKWLELPAYITDMTNWIIKDVKPNQVSFLEGFGIKTSEIPQNNIDNVVEEIGKVKKYMSSISYYSASQFSDPTRCPNYIQLDEDGNLQRPRLSTSHEKYIYDLFKLKNDDKLYARYLELISKRGLNLVDDIKFKEVPLPYSSYEVSTGGKFRTTQSKRRLIIPTFKVKGSKLSPNQLSEGTLRSLALVFYILNDTNELMLIEEPEVCIHHGLLSNLMSLIKSESKYKQVIISTHSDYLLDYLKPENIIFITFNNELGTTAKKLTDSIGDTGIKIMKEYLSDSGNLGDYWIEGGFDNLLT